MLLDIDQESVLKPLPADLDRVAAVMLWPEPEEKASRERAVEATGMKFLTQIRSDFEKIDLERLLGLAMESVPISEFEKQINSRFEKGSRAGLYLCSAIGLAELGERPSLKGLVPTGDLGQGETQEKTFHNLWTVFRPVAHFWAAWMTLSSANRANRTTASPSAPAPFPCPLEDFAMFLGLAEWYRDRGLSTRARQATRPLLLPDESVALPEWFVLRIRPGFE